MSDMAYLVTWESAYGDEGEGRLHVGVYLNEEAANIAAREMDRPSGFRTAGGFEVTPVPLTPPLSTKEI